MSKELQQYLTNPNVQAFLGMLRDAEGTANEADESAAYRTRFGGRVDPDLDLNSAPTFERKKFTQTDGKVNSSSATGAYQFMPKTWNGLQKQYGFTDFSPRTQDLAAIALLKQNGALKHIVAGDFDTALKKAGGTWASLPTSPYKQHKRSNEFVANSLAKYLGQDVQLGKYDAPQPVDAPKPMEEVSFDTPVQPKPEPEQPINFEPQQVAVLNDGSQVIPESEAEQQFLTQVNNSPRTDAEKARIAKMGVLFKPTSFDINFNKNKQARLPTELDPQLRQLIKDV